MNIKGPVRIFVFVSWLMMCVSSVQAQNIRMVTTEWEPFYSSALPSGGVVTELVREAFKREGHTTTLDWYPWMRAMKVVSNGEFDVAMGAYYSNERAKSFHYSAPLFSVDIGFIALKKLGVSEYQNLDSLAPYNIGVMRGWVYTDAFESARYLKKELLINQVLATRMLFAERVDMVAAAIAVFKHETELLKGHDVSHLVVLEPLLDSKPLHLMFSRKIPNYLELTDDFNDGLAKIRADGTFEKIMKKHGF